MVPAFGRLRTFSGMPVGSDTKHAAALVDIIAKTHISRKRRIDVPPFVAGSFSCWPQIGLGCHPCRCVQLGKIPHLLFWPVL